MFSMHPTSPFVKPATIAKDAMAVALQSPGTCVLGVKECREFLWTEAGPMNYDPAIQPRSQDLKPIFSITGGVHCAFGRDFLKSGAVSFQPASLVRLHHPESIDIDDLDDWKLAQIVADNIRMIEGST